MIRMMLLLVVSGIAGIAVAQPCPQGIAHGTPGCVPPGHPNSPLNNAPLPAPAPHWKLTWGALASDGEKSVIGTATGHFSQRAAKREAMAKCKAMGGTACAIHLTYKHQCAAIVAPTDELQHVAVFQGAATVELASDMAMKECRRSNPGRPCEVLYTNCTAPVLIR